MRRYVRALRQNPWPLAHLTHFHSITRQLLPLIEAALEPFEARPHFGKVFSMAPSKVQGVAFDKDALARFRGLVARYDEGGCFTNEFVQTYVLGDGGDSPVASLHH